VHAVGDMVGEPYRRINKTNSGQIRQVFGPRERSSDATDVRAALRALGWREVIFGDDVADADSGRRARVPDTSR
jgi:hypothetical protein